MRRLWLYCLPFLYLPNLGLSIQTAYGVLEFSDLILFLYLILVWFTSYKTPACWVDEIFSYFLLFVCWALISTFTISLRFDYFKSEEQFYIRLGLGKLAKFIYYACAGFLTAKALVWGYNRKRFHNVLLWSGLVVSVSIICLGKNIHEKEQSFEALNAISVLLAMLISYIIGVIVTQKETRFWNKKALFSLLIIFSGFILTEGRGGWFALSIGMGYLFIKLGYKKRVITLILFFICLGYLGYKYSPDFKEQIDMTLHVDETSLAVYHVGFYGFDEGARLYTWLHESIKLWGHVIFGTGFFHRGGLSGLWVSGSHNFLIQIFLETGVVGGGILLLIISKIWKQANSPQSRAYKLSLPTKVMLVTAFIGSLSGEYFYGGITLFTFLILYAPLGSLLRVKIQKI